MNLDRIAIVLSHPENSQNVGAVCRAMATCGIHDMRVVGSRTDYDDDRVRALAIHADKIWDAAQFFPTITAATCDCAISAGTTRRRGKKRKAFLMLPEEFAAKACDITDGTDDEAGEANDADAANEAGGSNGARAAVVFGGERTGLTDSEMEECTVGVTIPSSPEFASLNLSHAVQVVCYCLFRASLGQRTGWTAIDLERLDCVTQTIADALKAIGFFSVSGAEGMETTRRFWREVLSRSALSEGEAKYIEHIFNKARGLTSHHGINSKACGKSILC